MNLRTTWSYAFICLKLKHIRSVGDGAILAASSLAPVGRQSIPLLFNLLYRKFEIFLVV